MSSKVIRIVIALFALSMLVGARCAFIATSGFDSKDEEQDDDSGLIVVIANGRLIDGPVEGVRYESGSLSGFTGPNGEFEYEIGKHIRFSIGDIPLGEAVTAKDLMTPLDLITGGSLESAAAINIARLLQSLDSVAGDQKITIPFTMHEAAVLSNESIGPAIQSLDYADEVVFVNSASQLVATLTQSYRFTAMLVDTETAKRHLLQSFAQTGIRGVE